MPGPWHLLLTTTAEPTEQYLNNFTWNKIRYRADKPLGELIDTLQKVWRAAPFLLSRMLTWWTPRSS